MLKKPVYSAILCLSFVATAARGQNVFVLPGAQASGNTIQVLSSQFATVGTVAAGNSSFQILAKPDGSKYYVIANSGSQTVTTLDANFQNPRSLGNLGSQATAAAISPDGKKLLVVAGTLHVIDTTSDNDLTPNGVVPGTPFTDVAVSLDGTKAYVLGTQQSGQGVLYAIDLTSGGYSVVGNYPFSNLTGNVTVGPDGFVYVGGVNRVYQLNPTTLALAPSGEIQTIIKSGKISFTPDGKYALVPNQTPGQSSPSVILIDLMAHSVVTQSANIANAIVERLLVVSPTIAYGFSPQTGTLYQFTIPNLQISSPAYSGISNLGITAVSISNDVAGGSHASTQNLLIISSGNVYRVDIPSGTVTGPVALTNPQAQAVTLTGPFTNASTTPITILQYGGNQGLAQGATSGPVIARVLDANGSPVFGATVNFSTLVSGLTIQNPTVTTGANGYAVTTFTAPPTSGQAIITATAGTATANYLFNIGTNSVGGGAPTGGVSIVAGQGQLIFENYNTDIVGQGSDFIVKVTDISGKPVAGAQVTFDIATGVGSLRPGSTPDGSSVYASTQAADGTGIIVTSDANGLAAAGFLGATLQPYTGSSTASITATAAGTNSVTFYITVGSRNFSPTAVFLQPQLGTILTGQAGTTQKGAVQVAVVDGFGAPLPNVSVRLIDPSTWGGDPTRAPNNAYVACADPTGTGVLTDSTGRAVCDVVFTGLVISNAQFSVDAGYHYVQGPYGLNVLPGNPAKILKVQGDNQTGKPGQQLPLAFVVNVTDAGGNVLTGTPVTFKVITPGSGTLVNVSSATDQNGRASGLLTLGNIAGTYQVLVTAGTATASFSYTISIPAAGIQAVSGSGQTAVINTPFGSPLVVKLVDGSGAPVSGVQVTFAVTGGSASLGSATSTTDSSGQASTSITAGGTAGTITVSASAGALTIFFALISRLPGPTNVSFLNAASFQPGISPGSLAIIGGIGLLPGVQGVVQPTNQVGPMPTSLAGFSVTFNGIAAPISYVSNQGGVEQVSVQIPFELTPGTVNVAISATGGGSATLTTQILPVAPGIFTSQYNGQTYAVVVRPDGSYVTPANPAQRGEVDCTYATGLGQTTPTIATNSVGIPGQNVIDPMDFGLNNAGVRLVSATTVPGSVGIYQVCFMVPIDTQQGPYQPVGLIVHDPSGDQFAQSTFIPIQ
jgi:uncharacterized protein (TIGR03437 family)